MFRILGMTQMRSLIEARSAVLENETQVGDPMADQVELMADQVDLTADHFKEGGRLGSTWMGTWEAPSGVQYFNKM